MSAQGRGLLVIAFHYPPDNSSTGVLRTLKFTRHLLDHGWHSHVLTVPEDLYPSRDPALRAQIPPEVTLHRAPCQDARDRWGWRGRYPALLAIPDRFGSWRRPGIRAGWEVARRHGIRALFSTSPVPTAHRIALGLKRRTGLPWIADFRDPWAGGGGRGWSHRVDRILEGRVVTHADRIVANTLRSRQDFLDRYPRLAPERVVAIPNGFDEEDFAALPSPPPEDRFTLIYPGAIDPTNRHPGPLLSALGDLIRNGDLPVEGVRLRILGAGPAASRPWFRDLVAEEGLDSVLDTVGERIPYAQSLRILSGAGLLLVLNQPIGDAKEEALGYSRLMVPAKVYEFLRLGRPILALCDSGAVPDLLRETGAGWYCAPEDTEAIADRIRQAYALWAAGRKQSAPPATIAAYERRRLAGRLAGELDAIAWEPRPCPA